MKKTVVSTYIDYILLTFFILISGGSFTYGMFGNWAYLLFPIVLFTYINRGYKVNGKMILVVVAFAILFILQALMWNGPITSIIQPTLQIFTLILFARIIYPNFNNIFTNIIYFFATTSLVIWCISMVPAGYNFMFSLSQSLPQYGVEKLWEVTDLGESMYTCYLFSYSALESGFTASTGIVRNYGPFWEPGRFTIFLTIALMIRLYNNPKFDRKNIILLLADITTFSTTGYIALAILFIGYVAIQKKNIGTKAIQILFIVACIVLISKLDFMSEKITDQMNDLQNTESRFGAMAYHFLQISQSPIIGYGSHLNKAFSILEMSPNGWTHYMRYMGIPMFLTMIFFLYKGTRAYIQCNNRIIGISALGVILILAFTQTCMNDPFYYILYFMIFGTGIKTLKKETNNAN